MKRIIALILGIVMCASLCIACTPQAQVQTPTNTPTDAPTQAPTQAPTETPTEAPTQAPAPEPDQCLCGNAATNGDAANCIGECDGTWLVWTELTQTMISDLIAAEGKVVLPAGNYRLSADVSLVENGLLVNSNLVIDLNGHTFGLSSTKSSVPVFTISPAGKLSIVDSAGGGKVTPAIRTDVKGGIVSNGSGGTFHFYSGTLDGSSISSSNEGAVVLCRDGSKMFMYGGTVIGGATSNYGGGIYVNGGSTFKMTGGEIYGGSAEELGDNLYIGKNNGVVVDLLGGTVYGGLATSVPIIRLGGTIKILNTEKDGSESAGLTFRDPDAFVYVSGLKDGASIAFAVYEGKIAQGVLESEIRYFVAPGGYTYSYLDGELYMVTA